MEKKTARLTLLIDPHKKEAFENLCRQQDVTPSQVVRQLIRDYLQQHGMEYETQTQKDNPIIRSS
ncbi:TPA: CopG family transcriptional regulator [Klebsiella aerogenes]|uniref:ribbon-helix-helix domain-containing protein n=1 Tax=Klebsiella sp. HSTU-Sny5 TaxID=2663238 RepID=UPI001FB587E8|nr:ribbon-helix-helix domain-containing protein [Klebsiella sp. HSTU-Sny5]MCJ1876949.1 CopG family transcriptional regulator [Klebsiella sp. HSTU-Sny5]HEC0404116.1 CopG family transcriptional regulator [Klebsiella aerogenes]HEC1359212.1 CopG family transcriptional regulator [Klebsiella aerogenes]